MWDIVPCTGIELGLPVLGVQSLSHWLDHQGGPWHPSLNKPLGRTYPVLSVSAREASIRQRRVLLWDILSSRGSEKQREDAKEKCGKMRRKYMMMKVKQGDILENE